MLSWIIQQIILSLVVIILIHSIYTFLQNNLTTPKIRDLVNKPTKQYEEIYKTFEAVQKETEKQEETTMMKSELQNYLKELSGKVESKPITKEGSINMHDMGQGDYMNSHVTNNIQSGTFSDNFSPAYETL